MMAATAAHGQADISRPSKPSRNETQWLLAIQGAAERVNYTGTIVYQQQGGTVSASRIVHYFDGSVSHERLQMLDGQRREFVRRNDEVQCLFPDAKRLQVERRPVQDEFPSLGAGSPDEILERYSVKLGGVERVAGWECQVIELLARDAFRYGYRLCAERDSGLLLRSQTLSERRDVIEQMSFADVRIGERIDREQLKPSWSVEGWRVERNEYRPVDLAKAGWSLTVPAGFRKLREVERKMPRAGEARPAMQALYSDGLATLSVFIEAGAGANLAHDVARSQGATSVHVRRLGETLVTVVGEVPPVTVKSVAESVDFRPPR